MHFARVEGGEKELYGVLHPAARDLSAGSVAVLCAPIAQEQLRTHFAFRRLADGLARAGIPAFRFDYLGTGDSSGEFASASVSDWVADVRAACRQAVALTGAHEVILIGLRYGATLATLAAAEGIPGLRDLALWDPVVSGAAYLDGLTRLERFQREAFMFRPAPEITPEPDQLLGFVFRPALIKGISQTDLREVYLPGGLRKAVLVSRDRPEYRPLQDALGVAVRVVTDAGDWGVLAEARAQLLPSSILKSLIDFCAKRAPQAVSPEGPHAF